MTGPLQRKLQRYKDGEIGMSFAFSEEEADINGHSLVTPIVLTCADICQSANNYSHMLFMLSKKCGVFK